MSFCRKLVCQVAYTLKYIQRDLGYASLKSQRLSSWNTINISNSLKSGRSPSTCAGSFISVVQSRRTRTAAMAPKRKLGEADNSEPSKKAAAGTPIVNPKRWRELNKGEVKEGPVIYWMSRDQRAKHNWALLHACEVASKTGSPVAVVFNLMESYLGAGARQFGFMLRGLKVLEPKLAELNIPFFIVKGDATQTIPTFVADSKAALLVTDFAPTRHGREWRDTVATNIGEVPFHEVEAHNVVPTWVASDKRETGARTIRPKIHRALPEWFKDIPAVEKQAAWTGQQPAKFDWDSEIAEVLERGKDVPEVTWCEPGEDAGWEALMGFLNRLKGYHELRNKPAAKALSNLSPYYHFGQLSCQQAAVEVAKLKGKHKAEVDAFLEEAVVRRELSDNYVFYEPNYDNLDACAGWAKETLQKHSTDKREYIYTWDELEKGETHDELWNAAQHEMVYVGKMHGFMRMYWGKKILEWTESPEQALDYALRLNDKWELDGRDSNGYVGVMWSIGGVHDQGWGEREIFGKIRYMNYAGCKRKFDIATYVKMVNAMVADVKKVRTFPF
uniref:Deoxyribodipyrimidine photo-lyase n=1 Tax=Pohlia nutans TaxID=140635 RepID=A0A8F4PMY0_9BRYO|nr:CPD photolyase [Pohlia nutans]